MPYPPWRTTSAASSVRLGRYNAAQHRLIAVLERHGVDVVAH